ncbi:TIR domain-containing protein [Vibrio cholerae]|nr:TIR domain-containing protein [Vibrio cholerae]
MLLLCLSFVVVRCQPLRRALYQSNNTEFKVKVFISWSGERSRYIAEAIRGWLPKVIQAVEPWMSQEDIASGGRWSFEIASQLETSKFGILCITPENESNPWIMFEAGALSKTLEQTFLCPYLHQMAPSQLASPLSQFQAQLTDKEGTRRVLKSLNIALGTKAIGESQLDEIFEVWWPKLETLLQQCPPYDESLIVKRTTDELLEEIVDNTREQLRREEVRLQRTEAFDQRLSRFAELMESFYQHANSVNGGLKSGNKDDLVRSLSDVSNQMPKHMQEIMANLVDISALDEHFKSLLLNPPQKD